MLFESLSLKELYEIKHIADHNYYNTGLPNVMKDEEYDQLIEIIKTKDKNYIQKVGYLPDKSQRVKLPFLLGSLDKIKPANKKELQRWLSINNFDEFIVEPKLDGISCLLIKINDEVKMYTRGNGVYGTDISHLYKHLSNINLIRTNNICIRGELIINKNTFNSRYKSKFSNARNFVSGIVMSKTVNTHIKDIHFIAYEVISTNNNQPSPEKQLLQLKSLGIKTIEYNIVKKNELNVDNMINSLKLFKMQIEYEIDGIVVQPNKEYIRYTENNPKYSFAFKIPGKTIKTKVKNILWEVSKWGKIKPRIEIEQVEIDGVNINYTTGFNAKYIVDNKIGKDSIVSITRSGDVIPYITNIITTSEIIYPNIPYKWDENKTDFETINTTDTQQIKMIVSFFKKLDIKYISFEITSKLYFHQLNDIFKIINAKESDFIKIDGIQTKLSKKIYTNIQNGLKNANIPLLLSAYGIFGFGISNKKIEVLFEKIPNILDIYNIKSTSELSKMINDVPGFSNKSTDKILENLEKAKQFIEKIKTYTPIKAQITMNQNKGTKFINTQFVLSGFRDKKLQNYIEQHGGTISNSVSKNTFKLIIKDFESSKTTKKQKDAYNLNIPITSVEIFKEEHKIDI